MDTKIINQPLLKVIMYRIGLYIVRFSRKSYSESTADVRTFLSMLKTTLYNYITIIYILTISSYTNLDKAVCCSWISCNKVLHTLQRYTTCPPLLQIFVDGYLFSCFPFPLLFSQRSSPFYVIHVLTSPTPLPPFE